MGSTTPVNQETHVQRYKYLINSYDCSVWKPEVKSTLAWLQKPGSLPPLHTNLCMRKNLETDKWLYSLAPYEGGLELNIFFRLWTTSDADTSWWYRFVYNRRKIAHYLHIHVFIQLCCKMTWHFSTSVVVSVIFRQVVHIMEDYTVPHAVFHGLFEAHVEEHRTVKRLCAGLHRDKTQKCYSGSAIWPFS